MKEELSIQNYSNKAELLPENANNELKKYRALIKASNIGAWEYFPESDFLSSNDVYFSMLGRDIKDYDLSGNKNTDPTWIDLMHPDDKAGAIERFQKYLKKPVGIHESYFRMKHADGSWVWIWSRGRQMQ